MSVNSTFGSRAVFLWGERISCSGCAWSHFLCMNEIMTEIYNYLQDPIISTFYHISYRTLENTSKFSMIGKGNRPESDCRLPEHLKDFFIKTTGSIKYLVCPLLIKDLSASLRSIPQYAEAPPNIEAQRIISYCSAVLPC